MDFEDLARGEAAEQRGAHLGGVDAGGEREGERFGDRFDRHPDDDLIAGFGDLTGAGRSDVDDVLAEHGEDRLGARDRRVGAADHDRRVERVDALGLHRGRDLARRRGRDRAHVDVQRAALDPVDDAVLAEHDRLDVGRVGEHRDDDVAARGDVLRRGSGGRAVGDELVDRPARAVERDHREAGAQEVAGHRLPHDPQADETDGGLCAHDATSPASARIHPSVSSVAREGLYSSPTQPAYPSSSRTGRMRS